MRPVRDCAASLVLLVALFSVGCATEVAREPVAFVSAVGAVEPSIVFTRSATVTPAFSDSQVLRAGTVWKYVGSVPRGKVYAPTNDVFMLSGRHNHEAYCVITDGPVVVGFYLPVEQAFVSLPSAVPVSIKNQ